MFETAPLNPPDSIFGLIEKFKLDPNPQKINLSVGVYQDEDGKTPVMQAVHQAEEQLLQAHGTKNYLPIDGCPLYREAIGRLIAGDELYDGDRSFFSSAHTPGGTVSLRIAGELLYRVFNIDTIWVSNPTWANHSSLFEAAGMKIREYQYLDDTGTGLGFSAILDSLSEASPNQAILLHTVCHNPTGVDLDQDQWNQLFEVIREKSLVPIFDFAYQGFGASLDEDAWPIRTFASQGGEAIVCNSFSKNFGLYAERVGGITAVSQTQAASDAMLSQIKKMIRMMYSNPPMHGGAIVKTILLDPVLRSTWESELNEVRSRITDLRHHFVAAMKQRLPGHDFEYINRQKGMFSYSGLTKEQVDRLQKEFAIYALGTGRINVAGINQSNLAQICDAIASVSS